MGLKNSPTHYGAITKLLHWSVFLLFLYQYLGANLMTRVGRGHTLLGLTQGDWYNWHKSMGLMLLALAFLRLLWRRAGVLPDWAEVLTPAERAISHHNERLLYGAMLLMPVTGYLFVMSGGYGVKLFGLWDLPNPLGKEATLAAIARFLHILLAYGALVVIAWHVGLGLKKHVFEDTGFLRRMLPFGRRDG
jgi:cytochrome b561